MAGRYDFSDRAAIVTGGGRGIGREIALGLADCGAKLVLASRTETELGAVVSEIKANGGQATACVTDLMNTQKILDLVEFARETYGRIDILVNNSARSFMRSLLEIREDGYDKIFDVNVKAAFLLSRETAKVMIDQGGGRIVNITTVGAVRGGSGMGLYHASKAALDMLTKCMAVEWAPHNINVNAVGPGLTRTAFSQPIWSNPEVENRMASKIPKGRLAEPKEIVGSVLFLCSEDSAFITGTAIYVDGGSLAN